MISPDSIFISLGQATDSLTLVGAGCVEESLDNYSIEQLHNWSIESKRALAADDAPHCIAEVIERVRFSDECGIERFNFAHVPGKTVR